jgi:IMP dehydrogenase
MSNRLALTYDDIQLIPRYSMIKSRTDISLKTMLSRRYGLMVPLIASPMDTVCEYDMAYKMTALGGGGCVHRFMTIEEQCEIISRLVQSIDQSPYLVDQDWNFNRWRAEFKVIPICAAIGVSEHDKERAQKLTESGANVLIIDVAHGDHENVTKMIKWCKENLPKHVDIIAGNIATPEAAIRLQEAGVDGLRVGIGGGSVCSTRIKTGFGIPNVTCIENIRLVADVPIIADGGIRTSGDAVKALAVGADSVMIGSIIAGTTEAPGDIHNINGIDYKIYRGSASLETKIYHKQELRNIEGESAFIPYKGSVETILNDVIGGIQSGLSYAGAESIDTFFPEYIRVTQAGTVEGRPHLITK